MTVLHAGTAPAPATHQVAARRGSGALLLRGSAALMVAALISSVLGLAYTFLAARLFTATRYGELVALLSVAGLFGAPATTVQTVVARFTADAAAADDAAAAGGMLRRLLRLSAMATAAGALVWAVSVPAAAGFMHLPGMASLWWATALTGSALLLPALRGALQGLCRFVALAVLTTIDVACKVVLGLLLIWLGFGTAGAMAAMAIGVAVGLALTVASLRDVLDKNAVVGPTAAQSPALLPLIRFALPAAAVTGGVLTLMQADTIAARHFLTTQAAGEYAAVAVVARGLFWLSGAVATALLPVAARQRHGVRGHTLAWWSAAATAALCGCGLVILALAPALLLERLFGAEYRAAAPLLVPYGIAALLMSVGNVLASYSLGRGLSAAGVPAVAAVLTFLGLAALSHESGVALVQALQAAGAVLAAGAALVLVSTRQEPSLAGSWQAAQ